MVLLITSARSGGYPRTHKETALSTDWYTKLVLTVLAACAVFLVTQELRGSKDRAEGEGRYRLQVLPMGRIMLKIDSETGRTWRAAFPEPKVWIPIASEPVETLDDAAPEPGEDVDELEEAGPGAPAAPDPMAAGTP